MSPGKRVLNRDCALSMFSWSGNSRRNRLISYLSALEGTEMMNQSCKGM